MSYIATLDNDQKRNIGILVKTMLDMGVKNIFAQSGILAIVSKESGFDPTFESGYGNTSNGRIRKIFGRRVAGLNDAQLNALKHNDYDFFNRVYGGRYGNAQNEGYKYRGGMLNQTTFKNNYAASGRLINVDLANHPELGEKPEVAAKATVAYFLNRFKAMPSSRAKYYGTSDINGFTDVDTAMKAIYHANAGWAKEIKKISVNEPTGGFKKAQERVQELHDFITGYPIKNQEAGDKFRGWVNDKHPEVAKSINLDRVGSFDNSYIRKAWEQLGKYYV